jgi:hypothetical protein
MPSWPCAVSVRPNITPLRLSQGPINTDEVFGTHSADSLERARGRGFTAMQFNFVISSNERAVSLWQSCGFAIVGALPGAFAHPTHGLVDAYVMYRKL